MSTDLLAALILGLSAAVVIAIFLVLWRESTSSRQSWIALLSGVGLAAWATVTTLLALVPAFLVPLAFTLHVVSLWQLLGGAWPAASSVHRESGASMDARTGLPSHR